ncbi:SDR family NAD(P)-dependent oxidoreductase, partial [Staphylococcus aureus]
MTELNGRVAIITGASSGIGAATAKALEKQGVKVVLAGRSHDKLNTLAKDMNEDNIHIVPTDVTNQVEVDALVTKAID